MSWSVSSYGKAPAVRKDIAGQFERGSKCIEPEETVRQAVRVTMDAALAGQDDKRVVKVSASGSMSKDPTGPMMNSLSITIEPSYTFLE